MTMLTPQQIAILRDKLKRLREGFESGIEVRRQSSGDVEFDQSRIGRLSRMDALQQQAFADAADRRARDRLIQLKAASQRLDENRYGSCLDCSEHIGIERLLGDPCTLLCADCQEDREAAERREAFRRLHQGRRS